MLFFKEYIKVIWSAGEKYAERPSSFIEFHYLFIFTDIKIVVNFCSSYTLITNWILFKILFLYIFIKNRMDTTNE